MAGHVRFESGVIRHFEYNATVSRACPALRNTVDEVHDHWKNNGDAECTCGGSEPVTISVDYGDGIEWQGMACLNCMAITDGFDPYAVYEEDRHLSYAMAMPSTPPRHEAPSEPMEMDAVTELCNILRESKARVLFWVCPKCPVGRVTWNKDGDKSIPRCEQCGIVGLPQ
jgi:hypothetical protein